MKLWGILGFKNFILANLDDNYCLLSSHIEEWIITCEYCNQGFSILPNNSVWWWWSNASHAWSCVHTLYYWQQAPPIQNKCYDCLLEDWKESLPSIILIKVRRAAASYGWQWAPNSGILGQCLVMLSSMNIFR